MGVSGTAGGEHLLTLRNVTKRYGDVVAVDDLSLGVRDGEFFTIVGPSGSGKSTLIRILAGLETPSAGSVHLRDADITHIPANQRPTCMVFQSLALFRHRTVGENVEFAQKMRGVPKAQRRQHALAVMQTVRLPEDYYTKQIGQCSGGEQQRVALARALASDPDILFFDEPLSAMDYRLRKILEIEMKDLHARTGKTFVYITHSLEEAMVMSDRLAIMREGRIVQTGTPAEIYQQPDSRFVAQFMGEVNVFSLSQGRLEELNVSLPEAPEGNYVIVRPECLRKLEAAEAADVRFDASVKSDYLLGSRFQVHLTIGDKTLVAELPASRADDIVVGEMSRWGFNLADAAVTAD